MLTVGENVVSAILSLELDGAEESLVPTRGLVGSVHLEVVDLTLIESTRLGELLEGALRKVDPVLAAASALVDDADTHAGVAALLVIAELHKLAARWSTAPASHDGTDVRL